MALRTLSPSRAGDFKTCPQLFKFRAIDRIPEPPTVHQARGTTAHLALQRLFDRPAADRTPETLYDLFRQAWSELRNGDYRDLFDSVEAERAWGMESLELLRNYFTVEDPGSVEPTDRELDLVQKLDGMTIRGILDRVEEVDGRLVITDYKTGKAPPEQYSMEAFSALKIYALLLREKTGRAPDAVRLLYLNGPTVYELPIEPSTLKGTADQLRALWQAIELALDRGFFPPRPGRLCDWCSFQAICPAFSGGAAASTEAASG